jgi:G:T/U-mismatch repair DNA glycosylase
VILAVMCATDVLQAKDPATSAEYCRERKGLTMQAAATEHKEFIDVFLEAVEEQDAAAQAAVAPMVLWQPTTAQLASVKHQSINCMQQTVAARRVASQQQMATLQQSQEAVRFYYGHGVVVEQVWVA